MSEAFADFLNKAFLEYMREKGRPVSAASWAKYLGVKNASLSQWMNNVRDPSGDNVHRLAAKLGPKVYDLLGLPRSMPADNEFEAIASVWFELPRETRQTIINIALERSHHSTESIEITP